MRERERDSLVLFGHALWGGGGMTKLILLFVREIDRYFVELKAKGEKVGQPGNGKVRVMKGKREGLSFSFSSLKSLCPIPFSSRTSYYAL